MHASGIMFGIRIEHVSGTYLSYFISGAVDHSLRIFNYLRDRSHRFYWFEAMSGKWPSLRRLFSFKFWFSVSSCQLTQLRVLA